MKYVLDTNAVSAVMKAEPSILVRLKSLSRNEVGVPGPALAEIAYGIARLPGSKRKQRLRARYELVRDELLRVPWTDAVSEAFGAIKASLEKRGQLIEDLDIAIAAHALAHEAVLVTGDTSHMARVPGLTIEDWAGA